MRETAVNPMNSTALCFFSAVIIGSYYPMMGHCFTIFHRPPDDEVGGTYNFERNRYET